MRIAATIACAGVVFSLTVVPTRSDSSGPGKDWPMFRGNPALTGVSLARLPDKLQLLWTFKTGAEIHSSAAVVNGQVFLGSADANLYCISLSTGKKVWQFTASGPIESSPLVLDGRVYFGDLNTNVYALEASSGRMIWSYGLEDKIKSSPNWTRTAGGGEKALLIGGYDFKLYSFHAESGKLRWTYETGNYINGTPAIGDGVVAFGGCDALIHLVNLEDGTKFKQVEAGAYIAASGAIVGDFLYVGHYENEFLKVDLKEGKVAWRYKDRAFPFMSSPAATQDRVVVGCRDRRVHCLDARTGQAVWTFATRGKVESSPVIAGDRVVVGSDDGRLYLLGLADGKEITHYEIGKPIQASPAVVEGRVLVGSEDGSLYCFGKP